MIKKYLAVFLFLAVLAGALTACAPNYTDEFVALTDRFNEMNAEWSALMEEETALNAASPDFAAIDTYYDHATEVANAEVNELTAMMDTLESYQEGVNPQDYEGFMEVLNDTVNTTEVALAYFSFDRGWAKAKTIKDDMNELTIEWNDLNTDEKTLAVAEGYLASMNDLKDKLVSIKDEIDAETYDVMIGNLDTTIEAFEESIAALKAEEINAEQ